MAGEVEQEEDQPMEVEEKQPEPPKELETDALKAQPFLKAGQCCFLTEDTTMNVLPTVNGKLLMALGDGGFQYLLAGARANVGIKAGRYLFEVMIAEMKNLQETQGRGTGPKQKNLVRIGVSTSQSGLILGPENTESVCFDSTGVFLHGEKRESISKKFGHSQVAGLLVNLDPKSPNANTLSLFVNGERVSEPQPIPDSMKGKALFPAVSFRNVTLQVHFGAMPLRSLPFTCHSWLQVQKSHSEVKSTVAPKDGKYEVLLPVGLPDEGTFDWVDQFLSKSKNYTELSDRAIIDWAKKSGLHRFSEDRRSSNDKPEMDFGLPLMEDLSVSKVIKAVANVLPRNFIIPEVKANLTAEERSSCLARFPSHCYKKVVKVMVGEPPQDYKTFIQQALLKDKKEKAEAEMLQKKEEAARKKAQEEEKKAREKKEDDSKAEGGAEKEKDEGEKVEDAKEDPMEEEVHVELTEQEKKLWFRPMEAPDLTSKEMSSSYQKFTLPSKEEGFDELSFLWYKEAQSKEYLKKWVLERKMTQRVEDLQPSDWFRAKYSEWNKMLNMWKRKQGEYKDPARRKNLLATKKAEEKSKKEEEEKGDKKPEEENGEEEKEEKEKTEDGEKDPEKPAEEEPEEMKIDAESLDPFAVEDVTDIGNGEPLFFNFAYEDWALLSLRFELHLLCHAFRHDLDDPDRPTFKENHLAFYFNRYFRRQMNLKSYGVESAAELVDLVKDAVEVSQLKSLEPQLSEDSPLENFIRLTEDARRDRHLRIDSGDETALLKFQRTPSPAPATFGKGALGKGAAAFRQPPPTGGRPGFSSYPQGGPAGRPAPLAHRPTPQRPVTYPQKRPAPAPAPSNFPPKTQRTSYGTPATTNYAGAAAQRYGNRPGQGSYGGNSQGYSNSNAYNRR